MFPFLSFDMESGPVVALSKVSQCKLYSMSCGNKC
jgi:hypothetical protein